MEEDEVNELDASEAPLFAKARAMGRLRPVILSGPERLPGPRPRAIHGALCGRRGRL